MRAYSHRGEHSEDETDLCPSACALRFLYFIPCPSYMLVIHIMTYTLLLPAAGAKKISGFVTFSRKQEMTSCHH